MMKQQTLEIEVPRQAASRGSSGFKPLFDNFFSSQRPLFNLSERLWNPPSDVYETSDSIIIKMEIAGAPQQHLQITADNNFLIIRGRRDEDATLPKENYHLMEIHYGCFQRVFAMPFHLDAEDINAQYNNGFLIVTVAKRQPQKHHISVEVVDQSE
ncbi:Hsp20/alpha crystallin family protein [bacterium]|nr:Hsp20/alpha crystallin family protein [bacterium]